MAFKFKENTAGIATIKHKFLSFISPQKCLNQIEHNFVCARSFHQLFIVGIFVVNHMVLAIF